MTAPEPCPRCGSLVHTNHPGPTSVRSPPPSVPPVTLPASDRTAERGALSTPPYPTEPEPDDGEAIWVDSVGHRLERAEAAAAWIHVDGPIHDCLSIIYLLSPPAENVSEIPGLEEKFRRRRRYVLAFEADGEART